MRKNQRSIDMLLVHLLLEGFAGAIEGYLGLELRKRIHSHYGYDVKEVGVWWCSGLPILPLSAI